jgi:hypothetical protein
MKQLKGLLSLVTVGFIAVFFASSASAGVVELENRLPSWGDYGTPTIEFTDVKVKARTKKGHGAKRKHGAETVLEARSTGHTELSLFAPDNGYPGDAFDGEFFLDARLDADGNLLDGGTFGFYSNDPIFGSDDGNTVNYNCNKSGRHCSEGQLVFGGDLIEFGWSGSLGILEFITGNLQGWAMDEWYPGASPDSQEHIYMDVGAFSLKDVHNMMSFNLRADGFAVVPVPAAAWLFGGGLVALIGFARRKRK